MNQGHRSTGGEPPSYRPATNVYSNRDFNGMRRMTCGPHVKCARRKKLHLALRITRLAGTILALAMLAFALYRGGVVRRLPETIATNQATPGQQSDATVEAWSLVLVNANNPLPEDFSVSTAAMGDGQSVDARISDYLQAMLTDCTCAGYHPYIRSSYRTNSEQWQILNERISQYRGAGYSEEEALNAALQWVAYPGTSEHELGLAVDINDAQDDEEMYAWLADNAHRYGFVQRYPGDKVQITGISNEPWHYRYVGKSAADEMYRTGEVLEEYLERTKGQ